MTASRINYEVLAEIHPEFGEECYVCKKLTRSFYKTCLFSNTFI